MTVEEAVKLVISGGAVIPQERVAALVADGSGKVAHAVSDVSGTARNSTAETDSLP